MGLVSYSKIVTILFCLFLTGCQFNYLVKSSYYQLRLLSKRQSLDKALENPKIDEKTKEKIRLVSKVKTFAKEKMGLAASSHYESFVLLDSDYVVYAVTASPKNELKAYLWHFPIVGSVPYKGFFVEADADAEKQVLIDKGLDAMKRGVSAYSTLGWFSDPLLSSMTRYNDFFLVETVIHELTHATVYIKSHADFNESLANFVGNKGMEEYYFIEEGKNSPSVAKSRKLAQDAQTFAEFISKEIKGLKEFYKTHQKIPNLMEAREKYFKQIQDRFTKKCKPKMKTKSYDYFATQKLNNAILLNYDTYYKDLNRFEKAFEKVGKNWKLFIEFFESIKTSDKPDEELQKFINEPA